VPCETSYYVHRYTPLILFCIRVLLSVGRGTGPNENNGNRLYREHVRRLKDDYRLADCRRAKDQFVVEAIDAVTSKGGRFLRKVQKGKPNKGLGGRDLYEMADADAVVEKTRQAFQYCRRQRTEDGAAVPATSTGGETAPYPTPTTVTPSLQEHSDSSSSHSSRGSNTVKSQTTKKVSMPPHQLQDQVSVMPTAGFKTDAGPMGYGQGLIPSALGVALLGKGLQSMPHGPPSSAASGRHPIESVYNRAPALRRLNRPYVTSLGSRTGMRVLLFLCSKYWAASPTLHFCMGVWKTCDIFPMLVKIQGLPPTRTRCPTCFAVPVPPILWTRP
jgi:hypothetical protein